MATPANSKARVVVEQSGTVHVYVPAETLYNLDAIQQLQKGILGRVGCSTCCSGRQILFQQEAAEFTIG